LIANIKRIGVVLNTGNLLLDSLSTETVALLEPRLEEVALLTRTKLYNAGEVPRYAHFMASGIASVVSTMEDGATAEVGMIARDGLVQALHLMGDAPVPMHCMVQVDGSALRMRFTEAREIFEHSSEFRRLVTRQVQHQALALGQIAACNRLHGADERLARWLLTVHDGIQNNTFRITQEFIADMLGARRTTVALAAGALQRTGLIEYQRGQMTILDRTKLEAAACECYDVTRQLSLHLYGQSEPPALARRATGSDSGPKI
jgi:CRP-like cAMP-binding protein